MYIKTVFNERNSRKGKHMVIINIYIIFMYNIQQCVHTRGGGGGGGGARGG